MFEGRVGVEGRGFEEEDGRFGGGGGEDGEGVGGRGEGEEGREDEGDFLGGVRGGGIWMC